MTVILHAGFRDLPGISRARRATCGSHQTGRNPDVIDHVHVAPHIAGEPVSAGVLTDDRGIAGSVLGYVDRNAFEAWTQANQWLARRDQAPAERGASEDIESTRLAHRLEAWPDRPSPECSALQRVARAYCGASSENLNLDALSEHLEFDSDDTDGDSRRADERLSAVMGSL